jgi:hypothetical protein
LQGGGLVKRPASGPKVGFAAVERPPVDPRQLLASWMEWEKGETPPGQVMANLKTGGLRELLEELAAQVEAATATDAG